MCYITVGDIHIVHLGDLKHPLDEKHLGDFHDIDVLMVPVGGDTVLDGKKAAELVAQLEPRVIIPMHYKVNNAGAGLDGIDTFLKAMGATRPEVLPKLKLTTKDLPQDETRIVLLEVQ